MTRRDVPDDSILHLWMDRYAITEVPVSYQIICGLSSIGSLLKRNVYVDQDEWKVFPNMSVLLVGPSGIGKDVIINGCSDLITQTNSIPIIAGKTMESFKEELLNVGDPAACFTPAAELTAFLGSKDYQKSMVQELTDLLSTGPRCDISTKSEGKRAIIRPTITMIGGTTSAWLHKAMPEGSLDGGFLPRFVIVCEQYGSKHIPWVKYSNDRADRDKANIARHMFGQAVKKIVENLRPGELTPTLDARDYYTNWYNNRFSYFSPYVEAYANRSRDHLHRIAMLMAISRGNRYLEEVDYVFGAKVISAVAKAIDVAIAPTKSNRDKENR